MSKGQHGIQLVAPDEIDNGKVRSITPVSVFDVTRTWAFPHRVVA